MFMMSSTELTQRQRLDGFFLDYDMVPLVVAENALKNIVKLGEAGVEMSASVIRFESNKRLSLSELPVSVTP